MDTPKGRIVPREKRRRGNNNKKCGLVQSTSSACHEYERLSTSDEAANGDGERKRARLDVYKRRTGGSADMYEVLSLLPTECRARANIVLKYSVMYEGM